MTDVRFVGINEKGFVSGFKTVNGKEACVTMVEEYLDNLEMFKKFQNRKR